MTRADRIYVVDYDTSARNGLTRLLRTAGHDVRDFASAEDFLVNINSGVSGCLVLDARMPGMTGEELHAELEALEARLPIVVVSAGDDEEVMQMARQIKAVAFFGKPVDGAALLDAIKWALL